MVFFSFFNFVCLFIYSFCFLGPRPWHMEIPRLGVQWELQPTPRPQQRRIWASSVNYTRVHGTVRSLTHWVKPGIEPTTSWFLVSNLMDSFPLLQDGNLKRYFFSILVLYPYEMTLLTKRALNWSLKVFHFQVKIKEKTILFYLLFYWPHPWHVDVSRSGTKLAPQLWSEPQQWQHWILNPLHHQGTLQLF